MPLFRCFIRGDNFPGELAGQTKPVGFFTTRLIEAASPADAESLAVEMLREDEDLKVAAKYRTPDAKIYFEKIEEMPPDTESVPNKGFTFFTQGT